MKLMMTLFLVLSAGLAFGTPAGSLNEDGSFKLNEKSIKALGVVFRELKTKGPWPLPKESLVRIKFTTGIYRKYEGDITFVIVKVQEEKKGEVLITSSDLEPGDEVAVKGASFLRLAEADLQSDTVVACAH